LGQNFNRTIIAVRRERNRIVSGRIKVLRSANIAHLLQLFMNALFTLFNRQYGAIKFISSLVQGRDADLINSFLKLEMNVRLSD
jgi:hypothetical protein